MILTTCCVRIVYFSLPLVFRESDSLLLLYSNSCLIFMQMFIMQTPITSDSSNFVEFNIAGSTYEPIGNITRNGQQVRCSDYPALVEVATICAQCNDSSLDYNEVSLSGYSWRFSQNCTKKNLGVYWIGVAAYTRMIFFVVF